MEPQIKIETGRLPQESLFSIGKRAGNKKRNFLFISKLLGKHLEVYPDVCKAAGRLLASLRFQELESGELLDYIRNPQKDPGIKKLLEQPVCTGKKVLVLGFAETATGLGMGVAAALKDSVYYATSREKLEDVPCLFSFEEEHSHATTHRFYDGIGTNFNDFEEMLLVDDEITTGKSMLNLIGKLSEVSCVGDYTILTILDWRNSEHKKQYQRMMEEKGIRIRVCSVLSGTVHTEDHTVYKDPCSALTPGTDVYSFPVQERKACRQKNGEVRSCYQDTGRFGTDWEAIRRMEDRAEDAAKCIQKCVLKEEGKKLLILGEGEDIYFPSRVASHLEDYGHEVRFKTTTRSPVYCDGRIIREKESYTENGVTLYLYNRTDMEQNHDRILFLPETARNESISEHITTICL